MLLQRGERAVVPQGDRPRRPDDRGEMPPEDPGPARRGQSAEHEHAEICEVRHDHEIGEGRVHGVHDADGTAQTP
jgi:hypothetical protein